MTQNINFVEHENARHTCTCADRKAPAALQVPADRLHIDIEPPVIWQQAWKFHITSRHPRVLVHRGGEPMPRDLAGAPEVFATQIDDHGGEQLKAKDVDQVKGSGLVHICSFLCGKRSRNAKFDMVISRRNASCCLGVVPRSRPADLLAHPLPRRRPAYWLCVRCWSHAGDLQCWRQHPALHERRRFYDLQQALNGFDLSFFVACFSPRHLELHGDHGVVIITMVIMV